MTIDASIPLQSAQLNPLQSAQLAEERIRLQQGRQQIASQNALRSAFAQPGAIGPNGMPTQNTLARVMQIDPSAGMKLQDEMLNLKLTQAGLSEKQWKAGVEVGASAKDLYDQQVDQGVSPAQAQKNAQTAYSQSLKQLAQSGLLSPEQVAMLNPTFDPQRVASNMDMLRYREQKRENQQRIGLEGERVALDRQNVGSEIAARDAQLQLARDKFAFEKDQSHFAWQPGMGTDPATGKMVAGSWRFPTRGDGKPEFFAGVVDTKGQKWEVLTDPTKKDATGNPAQYRYNPATGQATTLDGQPYAPGGAAKIGGASSQSALSGTALDQAAKYYHETGIMPAGTRNRADVEAILNRAAAMFPSGGSQAERTASYKADSQSLAQLTKQRDAATAFESSAAKEMDLAVQLMPKTAQHLDSQLLTKWIRSGATKFGDTNVPKFQAALISALDEYAKVLSGATGAAGSTDAARAQAAEIIPPGATTDQIPAIIETLKQGMAFKTGSYDEQIASIKKRLGGGDAGSAPSHAASPATGAATASDIPSLPVKEGKIDAKSLEVGKFYTLPDKTVGQWDGTKFRIAKKDAQ